MAYRATHVGDNPLKYFMQNNDEGPYLRVADVVLRENKNPTEILAHLIRMATASKWSHSAILYLTSDPQKNFNPIFLVEAKTKGVHIASWHDEVFPFNQFTVGIKRLNMDWYVETPYEHPKHAPTDPHDIHGISYLRDVRDIALKQVHGLYDKKTVYELTALYVKRAAKRHLSAIPQVANAADIVADFFKKWDESQASASSVLRLICSGLVQYSFFEALRRSILKDFDIPAHRDAAMSNLNNLHRIIFRDDEEGIIDDYKLQVQSDKLDIHKHPPDDVLDLLKTATPADFNNTPNLQWHYVILKGGIWKVDMVADGYQPQSDDEREILQMIEPEYPPDP